jgi:hypothetical protein
MTGDEKMNDKSPRLEALSLRYTELHTHFREAINIFLKGSVMMLAVIGASLGYLFTVQLGYMYSRIVCATVLIIILFWYICACWGLRLYKQLTSDISAAAESLSLPFSETSYKPFKVIVSAAIGCMIPITSIYIYFLLFPPHIVAAGK